MVEHERIWLEPKADEYGCEGRTWCDHNAWGDGAVEYVRASEIASLQERIRELEGVLRNIAEGNLGDASWQANYDKIREVARAAIIEGEQITDAERLGAWATEGPKLAAKAGCYVEIKISPARPALKGAKP